VLQGIRILAGLYKGRRLSFLPCKGLRPSAHCVRKSVFDILLHRFYPNGLKEFVVFDLFAGLGSYGFEALSRGAAHCVFVEKEKKMAHYIHQFAHQLQCVSQVSVIMRSLPLEIEGNAEVIFLDPPYDLSETLLKDIISIIGKRLKGIGVLEFSHPIVLPDFLQVLDRRHMGNAWITFFRKA
jgi:16S rRNA (guanine966-N2)-methyltransferase